MRKNADSNVKSRLRWQLFGVWTVLLIVSTGVVFFTIGAKVKSLILNSEVEKLRPAARELRELCADYLLSPSDRLLKAKFAKIMKDFPDLSYVFFVDRHSEVHSHGKGKSSDSLYERLSRVDVTRKDVNVLRIDGETYIDIAEVTRTLPPLPVHAGFAKSLTDGRTRTLLWNRAAIALVVLAGGLGGGFLLLTWLARPIVDLSDQAEKLSLGDMSVRLDLKCRGEIGKVYCALERLKESTLYALRRLNDRQQPTEYLDGRESHEDHTLAQGESRWQNLR